MTMGRIVCVKETHVQVSFEENKKLQSKWIKKEEVCQYLDENGNDFPVDFTQVIGRSSTSPSVPDDVLFDDEYCENGEAIMT